MRPLSKWRRRLYLWGLLALFALILPSVIFYASGYRIVAGMGVVRTGGIHVSVPQGGAKVYADGVLVGTSGFLNRGFYISDLLPGSYVIRVERDGFYDWSHAIVVEQQVVTESGAVLFPEEITLFRLASSTALSTSTRTIDAELYERYRDAFRASMPTSTPSGAVAQERGIALFVERGNVYARWTENPETPAPVFCARPSYCLTEIGIEEGRQRSTEAGFFGGGVVYRTIEGGIFIREATVRPGAVHASIYSRRGADFRIIDGKLIVKYGNDLYEVDPW